MMVTLESTLIENVRQHEALFDVTSGQYRDLRIRNEAWEEIGEDLRIPAAQCRDMWNKLRNCYMNAIRRRRTKKGQALAPWKYEEQMSFLLPFVEFRSGVGVDSSFQDSELVEAVQEGITDREDEEGETLEQKFQPDLEGNSSRLVVVSSDGRKRKPNFLYVEEPPLKKVIPSALLDADEMDLFFLSMARIMKRLPALEQAKIRMEICKLITEVEIKTLQ